MTQIEKLIARLKSLDPSSLYNVMLYVTPDGSIGFWVVRKEPEKVEGEQKSDYMVKSKKDE